MLTGAEVDALVNDKPGQWAGGMFTASDSRAEPFKAVPALARALQARGGSVREHCAVRALDVAAGRVAGVVTEHGRVRTNAVVCAAGAWSTRFLGNLGVDLPQLSARATVARTAPAPNFYEGGAILGEVAIRRRQDGGYTVAIDAAPNEHSSAQTAPALFCKFLPSTQDAPRARPRRTSRLAIWSARPADAPLEARQIHTVRSAHASSIPGRSPESIREDCSPGRVELLPSLADVPFEEAWAGMIDVDAGRGAGDRSRSQSTPACILATGFSGHGFGIGPGAGRVGRRNGARHARPPRPDALPPVAFR